MMKVTLRDQEHQQLVEVMKTTPDGRLRMRCQAVLMAARGRPHSHVAEDLAVSRQGTAGCGLDRANWTYEELATYLYQAKGLTVSATTVRTFCQRHGVRPYRPTYQYLKAAPARQEIARRDLEVLKKSRGGGTGLAQSR